MEPLSKISFKWKLLLMIVIPLASLAWFTTGSIQHASALKAETHKILLLADISVKSSTLVHELQKERGASAGFIGSAGSKFVTALPEQRKLTDQMAKAFTDGLAKIDGQLRPDVMQTLKTASKQLAGLNNIRDEVSSLTISTKKAVATYTEINTRLIEVIAFLPKISSVGEINNADTAYVNFILSKERAGIERAVLASTFAKDEFTNGSLLKLNQLIVEQNTYFERFSSLAINKHKQALEDLKGEAAFVESSRLRKVAIDNAAAGGFGVDPEYWFKVQTQKINHLKQFETMLSESIVALVQSVNNSANSSFATALIVTILSTFGSVFVAWVVARSILQQLGTDPEHLRNLTHAIAHDDLDVSFSDEGREITGVFASLRTMRDKLRDQIINEREAAAGENARIRNALDNASNNLTLVDNDLKTLYSNKAMLSCINKLIVHDSNTQEDHPTETVLRSAYDDADQHIQHLKAATAPGKIELNTADRTVRLIYSPICDENNVKSGMVVEWLDITEQVRIQEEIRSIINAAKAGNLTQRIDTEATLGFFRYLSTSVNELLEVTERAVNDTGVVISAVAHGDLSSTIDAHYEGSFGQLKSDVNSTVHKLTEVVTEISSSAELVKTRSVEISEGTSNVSERTERQAANLEETAASMEEMTARVRQTADNASRANQLTASTLTQAKEGGKVVYEAVAAMTDITESSNKIAAIISVIDEIAFQTNLLALNAAVEAARAGEQGQGFAVVASEVRNLAGRSATAAKEIKDLIEESVNKIEGGSELVGKSGTTLEHIVTSVTEVVEIVDSIAFATQEQRQGIEQVNRSIAQIDETTQDNAALVEESANASRSMRDQAQHLKEMIGFFRTNSTNKHISQNQEKHASGF